MELGDKVVGGRGQWGVWTESRVWGVLVQEGDVSSHLGSCPCVLTVEGSGLDPGDAGLDLGGAFFNVPL